MLHSEAVHVFTNPFIEHSFYATRPSIARFDIPARHGPGDYILWFLWAGYKDCVDINVMSADHGPVMNRYGMIAAPNQRLLGDTVRIDHCEWQYQTDLPGSGTFILSNSTTMDARECVQACRNHCCCNNVAVFRKTNPARALTAWINDAYHSMDGNDPACTGLGVQQRLDAGCTATAAAKNQAPPHAYIDVDWNSVPDDAYVCQGVYITRDQVRSVNWTLWC